MTKKPQAEHPEEILFEGKRWVRTRLFYSRRQFCCAGVYSKHAPIPMPPIIGAEYRRAE